MHTDRLSILRAALRDWAWWHVNGQGYPGVSPSAYRQAGTGGAVAQRLPRGVNVPCHVVEVMQAFGHLEELTELRLPLGAVRGWYLRGHNRSAKDVARDLGVSLSSFQAYRRQGELVLLTTIANLQYMRLQGHA